jgi:hypothetical protein
MVSLSNHSGQRPLRATLRQVQGDRPTLLERKTTVILNCKNFANDLVKRAVMVSLSNHSGQRPLRATLRQAQGDRPTHLESKNNCHPEL